MICGNLKVLLTIQSIDILVKSEPESYSISYIFQEYFVSIVIFCFTGISANKEMTKVPSVMRVTFPYR